MNATNANQTVNQKFSYETPDGYILKPIDYNKLEKLIYQESCVDKTTGLYQEWGAIYNGYTDEEITFRTIFDLLEEQNNNGFKPLNLLVKYTWGYSEIANTIIKLYAIKKSCWKAYLSKSYKLYDSWEELMNSRYKHELEELEEKEEEDYKLADIEQSLRELGII